MNNKRGQSLGLGIISIVFFLIIAFSSINFIMTEVSVATAALSCDSAETISAGNMFLCLMTDATVIYFMAAIISVIIGTIVARLLI